MPANRKKPHPELSPAALALIASRFKILADPTRLSLLHALHEGELTVGTLVERTGGNQANVSKHLSLLTSAGMVARRRENNFVHYSGADPVVFELCEMVCSRMANHFQDRAEMLTATRRK
jgi:ArsR family transcriptional regulator